MITGLVPRPYPLMEDAVEAGVRTGYRRAHKHVEAPSEDAIRDAIVAEVMTAICERFAFVEDPDAA